jgi:hypothetical protein
MASRVWGVFCIVFAGANILFMLDSYPSPFWLLHCGASLWFTYRAIWWFDRNKLPSDLTPEQIEEVKQVSELARQMLVDGKDKQEVTDWLNARLKIIRSRGQNETNQSE